MFIYSHATVMEEIPTYMMAHDGVKTVVAAHDHSMTVTRVEGHARIPHGMRGLRYVYEYMINDGRMDHAI